MIHALYHRHPFQHFRQPTGSSPLEAAVAKALLDGELSAGDPLANPHDLGKRLEMTPSEVLDAIGRLLSQRMVTQDEQGNLFIDEAAVPAGEVSKQALALRTRQLSDAARQWQRPTDRLSQLLREEETQLA